MNQENKLPSHHRNYEKLSFVAVQARLEELDQQSSSITPKRPLLSRDRSAASLLDKSPLTDCNYRSGHFQRSSPIAPGRHDSSSVSIAGNHTFNVSAPPSSRSLIIEQEEANDTPPTYIHLKARPAPATTWKAPVQISKSSTLLKTLIEPSLSVSEPAQSSPIISFQPAIRARIPFNLSSTNTIEKQTHAYTFWLNGLFTPVEYLSNPSNSTVDQSIAQEAMKTRNLKFFAECNRWHSLCDRAREVFAHDIQAVAAKIGADIDIDQSRINPQPDLNFSGRTVNRQALLNFIGSYNRTWFRLAMEILFPIKIENYQQMKLAIDQYLIQSTMNTSSPVTDVNAKKAHQNNAKTASIQIRLTMKNLLIIIIFLERAKLLRLIDNDPCLYVRESKFKSTKESIDVFSRDFISSDTNLIRRLKLAGFEPLYRQTSLDEYNYLISTNENKLFDELKDGIRLTRSAQILLASSNEQVARFDLSTKLKCPVVNLVHKLLNIDQALELLQTYGQVNLTGISNKDIMTGNKQRTLELLWRIFLVCYLPKQLSPIDRLNDEISLLTKSLSKLCPRSVERQLLAVDILPIQKQQIDCTPLMHGLIKWVQLICAHYKFWLYDLQESFADGRAFLFVISYYLPSLCDYAQDIKHLTTLATCQSREEHLQFNAELGRHQSNNHQLYERNVKSNFRCLEECIKQFGSFPSDLVKYESYAKDLPDERCTMMILAMLAHDLLFLNTVRPNEFDFRSQPVFEELREKYSQDAQFSMEMEDHGEETTINTSIEESVPLQLSISSSIIDSPVEDVRLIPIVPFKPSEEEVTNPLPDPSVSSTRMSPVLSPSVLQTMNNDILEPLELISEGFDDEDEESFNTAKLGSTTMFETRRASISAAMATLSLDDFVELEKTIENEEMKNHLNKTPSLLIDDTIFSETDSLETNKTDEASFTDPVHTKMLKETLIQFLTHPKHEPLPEKTSPVVAIECETRAATVLQSHWRGQRVRQENERDNHPVVATLAKLRSINPSSLTLRERMMQIVREYSDSPSSSLSGYLYLLREMKPMIAYSLELRHLIAEQGLLRLFFILMRCCNRSEPSNILLSEVLQFLQLFTVRHDLTMKLIEKQEQIKDFNMLLLKYYQNNGWELFEQICALLQLIVNDQEARRILRTNRLFTEAVEYVYKRLFNKASIDEERSRQQVRSTPKHPIGLAKRRVTLLNRSSMQHITPQMRRRSAMLPQENVFTKNLLSIEKFMKVFYHN